MKKFTLLLLLATMFVICSCNRSENPATAAPAIDVPSPSSPDFSSATLTIRDSINSRTLVCEIHLERHPGDSLSGSWNDEGTWRELIGTMAGGQVHISLHPRYRDYGIYLDGTLHDGRIDGTSSMMTIVTTNAYGTFTIQPAASASIPDFLKDGHITFSDSLYDIAVIRPIHLEQVGADSVTGWWDVGTPKPITGHFENGVVILNLYPGRSDVGALLSGALQQDKIVGTSRRSIDGRRWYEGTFVIMR